MLRSTRQRMVNRCARPTAIWSCLRYCATGSPTFVGPSRRRSLRATGSPRGLRWKAPIVANSSAPHRPATGFRFVRSTSTRSSMGGSCGNKVSPISWEFCNRSVLRQRCRGSWAANVEASVLQPPSYDPVAALYQPKGTAQQVISTMRAIVLDKPGPPAALTIRELPVPKPAPGWVLIKVEAFGLNRSELHTRLGLAEGVTFPRVLGIEATGVVAECPGHEFRTGQQVMTMMGGMGRVFD